MLKFMDEHFVAMLLLVSVIEPQLLVDELNRGTAGRGALANNSICILQFFLEMP